MNLTKFIAVFVGILIIIVVMIPAETVSYSKKDDEKTKEKDELRVYLDALEEYECRGCPHGFKRVDTNGLYSYGCLQFQQATFKHMVDRYGLVPKRKGDRSFDISRCEDQKRVAYAMFQDNPRRAAGHWYHSIHVRGLGLPQKE